MDDGGPHADLKDMLGHLWNHYRKVWVCKVVGVGISTADIDCVDAGSDPLRVADFRANWCMLDVYPGGKTTRGKARGWDQVQ